jgi:MFS family permease
MFGAVFTPLFLFMAFCMFCTANTELSTTQWIDVLLGNAGANALLILALVNGIMACGRYFGGPLIHRFSPKGILLLSAAISILGVYLLRTMDGNGLYVAAVVFAVGVCFFWPTMLGFVSENVPKSGALGLSIMGGVGMLGNWAFQTYYIGPRLEEKKQALEIGGMVKNQAELMAGREILSTINILPVILVLAFGALWLMSRKK